MAIDVQNPQIKVSPQIWTATTTEALCVKV